MRTFDIAGTYIKGKVELENPGDFIYYVGKESVRADGITGMVYICPCGCGSMKTIKFRPSTNVYVALYTWNDNIKKPTISPELICYLKDGWKGRLEKGVFKGIVE